jgi:Tfp pilus assembly pilus retraction ATPase PilT
MQTMDAHLAQLVRTNRISRKLAEQRASVPEELKRLLGPVQHNEVDPALAATNGG